MAVSESVPALKPLATVTATLLSVAVSLPLRVAVPRLVLPT